MIAIAPIKSEKSFALTSKGIYTFLIDGKSSKQAIKEALEKEFSVTIISIRTQVRDGKPMRFSRGKRAYPGTTTRQDKKIAYVTLKEGDKIKIFDEDEVEDTKGTTKEVKASRRATAEANAENKEAGLFVKRRTGNRGDK